METWAEWCVWAFPELLQTGARYWKSSWKDMVAFPQYANLWLSTRWQSLRSYVLDEKTNVLICVMFMSTTMKASVHLGPSYNEKLVAFRNTDFKELKTLFGITQRLILEQSFGILNVSTIVWNFTPWMGPTLTWPGNQVAESKGTRLLRFSFMSGKYVCSFRGEWEVEKSTPRLWQGPTLTELCGIDGEPSEVEWNIFPGLTSLEIFQRSTRIWMIDK